MDNKQETIDRYQLLEELLSIPGTFGFSIPRMDIIERLTHKGREYEFYYDDRNKPFMTFIYDGYQKKVSEIKISEGRMQEFQADKERFTSILESIAQRILEKNEVVISPQNAEYEGFLTKTKELTALTKHLAEEMAVMENKEAVKEVLSSIEEQLTGIQELIEQQKVNKLKEALQLIDSPTH